MASVFFASLINHLFRSRQIKHAAYAKFIEDIIDTASESFGAFRLILSGLAIDDDGVAFLSGKGCDKKDMTKLHDEFALTWVKMRRAEGKLVILGKEKASEIFHEFRTLHNDFRVKNLGGNRSVYGVNESEIKNISKQVDSIETRFYESLRF
jgi:hypothetical protein